MEGYEDFSKIDAHIHFNADRPALLKEAPDENFRLLSINTEVPFFPELDHQEEIVLNQQKSFEHGDRLAHLATFSTDNWGEEGWGQQAVQQIKNKLDKGAVGVKVWKNIGMELQDEDGNFVMIDHASFDPVFEYCERNQIPILGHLGEPKNCWLPLEQMTVTSDREYFAEHPEYHMHKHPEFPSYDEQVAARDRRLEKHPKLQFVGAHLASLEWSVDRIAGWLDRFPNAAVDLAERICHLQYQAVNDHRKMQEFVDAYQDRIIYGTDVIDDGSKKPAEIRKEIRQKWQMHWRFFAEGEEMEVSKVERPFKGLSLDQQVLKKIFHDNALKWYHGLEDCWGK